MWKICTFHLIYNYSLAAWFKVQLEYVSWYSQKLIIIIGV